MGKRRRSDANESEGEAPTTPSAKRASTDKWSFPDELKTATHLCQKLYDFLRRAKDDENRLLCECLVRVPSRRSHPQYYDVIKTPIDLMRIQQKLKTDEYRSVHDFLHHVRLLLENARSFFGEGSEEVACVDQLETRFTQRLQEYAGHFTHSSGTDSSPPSLTLRISKDQLQGLSSSSSSSGKTSQSGLSRQQQPRSKLTRSKAWLQGYMSSGDPLKLFLAAVYEHTDSTGVCIAEVFHELPSAKDYPEYYEVITEPIDLHTIKRNLEEGRYSNLRDIQEDMILMIKNAHYFNEPGSDVYKFASTLRKFVISHCADLERRFHTVTPKPLKVSLKRPGVGEGGGETRDEGEGDEKKIPKLKVRIGSDSVGEVKIHSGSSGEAGVKVSRRLSQSSKTPDTEDESANSESSGGEDSSQSEDEGEGEVVRKKAKVSRGKEREDQLAKLLKSRNTPPLKKQALALYHHLVRHRDAHGRQTAELFMRKPSAKMYPEYYIVIRSPIDFREISHKIKTEQYTSLEEVMKDVELLVGNATTFNEEDSTVYQDALTLQQLARNASNRLQTVWPRPQPHPHSKSMTSLAQPLPPAVATPITVPSPRPRGRPRKHPLPPDVGVAVGGASIQSPISSLFMAIKMFTLQGRGLWRSLQNQPTVGSEARKEFSTISMKIATGKFLNVHQLYQELHQSLDHVVQTQPAESLLYRDALILCRVAAKKYLELTADERGTPLCPNVQEAVQGMLRSVLTRTLQCPEAEGLREVVVTREIQADGDEPPTTHKLSLPLMEKWVERCCYRRLDSLQNDLLSILSFAAEQSPTLCQSAVAVGRAYIGARDAMVTGGKGGRLTSPALSYTAEHLEHDIAGKMGSSDKKGVEPVAEKTTAEGEVGKAMEGAGSGETFDELVVAGKTYRVGDVVYLTSRNAGQKPHIVSIDKLWRDSTGAAWLQGCWFYRPEETFHLATRKFYEKEVFKSDFHSVAMLSEVQGPCCVLVLKDYVRSSPIDFPEDDVFVCESRYAHKAKSFKKIKNWSYPLGRQPRLITRDVPLSLRRVPSVFMTQSTRVKGSGSQSVVPVSDTVGSSDKDAELFSEAHGSDPSLPHPVQLENVKACTVSNPTTGCTYYEQYCIDEDKFRLGDCVYVRSDQEKPFVARIDRMWTDANGDPWFHGPWFVYPEEISHTPTRLFLERELFMSNIHDTNPMRSIIGRCSVLPLPDYSRKRLSEFSESDVFVVESRYLEAEGEIRKIVKTAALRPPQLSRDVQEDEVFVFHAEIHPRKLPSPKLLLQVTSPATLAPSSGKPSSLSSQASSGTATPVPAKPATVGPVSSSLPTPPGGPQLTAMSNVVNINPQLLQALLATVSQANSSKPVILPLPQSPPVSAGTLATPTTLVQSSPYPTPSPASQVRIEPTSRSASLVGYICLWDECGENFNTLTDLTTHLMLNADTTHLVREADGNFYCRWANCPRNPRHGGRTFDAMPKITRHVKEVHLLKLSQTALGLNPRSHVIQGQVVRPPAPSPPAPSPVISLSSIPLPSNFASSSPSLPVAHIPIVTPPPVPIGTNLSSSFTTSSISLDAQQSVDGTPAAAPVSLSSSVPSTAPSEAPTTTSSIPLLPISSIFVAPPVDKKPILHSAIYTKYIEGLQNGSKYSSSLQTTDQMSPAHRSSMTSSQVQVSDWLLPSAIPPNMSATEALVALRDHLLRDSLRLGQHLDRFQ